MTRGTGEPTPERRPLSVGTGNTGNPCEYPGCTDKNASLSTMWERPDQDHDFGGTNRELRCVDHWGKDAPRAPRPREPLPTDTGYIQRLRGGSGGTLRTPEGTSPGAGSGGGEKKRRGPNTPQTGSASQRGASTPRASVDMAELNRMCRRVRELLRSDPALAAELCARALEQEKAAVVSAGPRAKALMDTFRVHRRNGLADARARASARSSMGSGEAPVRLAGPLGPMKQEGMRELSPQERKELDKRYHVAKGLVARDPGQAIGICDSTLRLLKVRSGSKTLRDLLLRVRSEALVNRRRGRR